MLRRHALLAYLAFTFAISWGGVLLVVALAGTAGTREQAARLLPLEILAMLAGPSAAGILMTGVVHGRAGLRALGSRLFRWRAGARWYAAALLTAPIVTILVFLGLSLASPAFLPGAFASDVDASMVVFGLVASLVVGLLEELGWTGFALPALMRRHAVVKAALVVGVAWGAWHILTNDVLAVGGYAGTLSPAVFVIVRGLGFLVGGLPAYRVLMSRVYERTGNLPLAMLMHAALTASALILQPAAISGAALLLADLVTAVAWWIVVGAVALARGAVHLPRRKPAYAQR